MTLTSTPSDPHAGSVVDSGAGTGIGIGSSAAAPVGCSGSGTSTNAVEVGRQCGGSLSTGRQSDQTVAGPDPCLEQAGGVAVLMEA